MEKELNFKDAPRWWAMCFNNDCALRERCLRYLAGQQTPANRLTAPCVLPAAWRSGQCKVFNTAEPVRAAFGFKHIFDDVRQSDAPSMRRCLKSYLGSNGCYYEYYHGIKPLKPERQNFIERLFTNKGYDAPTNYDRFDFIFDYQDIWEIEHQ